MRLTGGSRRFVCGLWTNLHFADVQVRKPPAAIALQVFSVESIVSCAHVIPEIATSSKTEGRRKERWIVNTHMDLATWNDVYN